MIVCSVDVCGPGGSFGGKMPGTDYVLRYQTNPTSDGNVAGWHGPNVKWNESSGTFTIGGSGSDSAGNKTTVTQTLVPEKTASDGKNLHTGIVSSVTTHETATKNDQSARVVVEQKGLDDANAKTTVTFPEWSGGKTKVYDSPARARASIEADVRADLTAEGYPVPDASGSAASGAGVDAGASATGDAGAGESVTGGEVALAGDAGAGDGSDGAGAAGAGASDDAAGGDPGDGAGDGSAGGDEGDGAAEPEVPVFVQTILDLTDQVKTFLDDFFGWLGFAAPDEPADEPAGAAEEVADESEPTDAVEPAAHR